MKFEKLDGDTMVTGLEHSPERVERLANGLKRSGLRRHERQFDPGSHGLDYRSRGHDV